jgi:large subunit ribosomal protein L4
MKFDVVDTQNKKVGDIDLEDSVFGASVREHLFWEVVRMQLANRRRGTHSTKTVSEVRGSGIKPYRQKGTGRARHGSRRAMNMRGGGIVFGPKPRDYSYKMPKKAVATALRSALSLRAKDQALRVVKGWSPDAPKTKDAQAVISKLGCEKTLVVGAKDDVNLQKSVRNLAKAKFLAVEGINVYDILKHDHLILTEDAAATLSKRLKAAPSRTERALQGGE